jgi:ubiquinone/menaquinone biosynthesis C-methylase UbiE
MVTVPTSTAMLAVGRERAAERGLSDASTFVEANAEALPFETGRFDAVYDRLRHPQRAAHRRGAVRSASAC